MALLCACHMHSTFSTAYATSARVAAHSIVSYQNFHVLPSSQGPVSYSLLLMCLFVRFFGGGFLGFLSPPYCSFVSVLYVCMYMCIYYFFHVYTLVVVCTVCLHNNFYSAACVYTLYMYMYVSVRSIYSILTCTHIIFLLLRRRRHYVYITNHEFRVVINLRE